MYSIVISNETVSLDWTEIIQTKVNLEEQFTLEKFQIKFGTGNNESTKGDAIVEWVSCDETSVVIHILLFDLPRFWRNNHSQDC